MEEKVIRHVEMIQSTINRLAHCSFLIKGWTITLAIANVWIMANKMMNNTSYTLVLLIPILLCCLCWVLDGFFLNQEQLFRHLFDSIRTKEKTDFSMKTDMSQSNWCCTCFSKTLLIFYWGLIVIYLILIFLSQ